MTFSSLKSTTVRLALAICTLGLAVTLSGCGTGGGVRIGGGTATGAVAGGIYSLATQDGGRGALIGTGVGMFADLLNGQPPLEVEPYYGERRPVYHGYQGYQPDYRDYQRDYRPDYLGDGPSYRGYQSEYREVRRYYDSGCYCYYND
jgi:hypothetical protein